MAQARIQIFWEGIQGKLQGGGGQLLCKFRKFEFSWKGGGGERIGHFTPRM